MAATEGDARRLYVVGFEGWDISLACIYTDCLVALVALAVALAGFLQGSAPLYSLGALKRPLPRFPGIFVAFCMCEAVTYASGGFVHYRLRGHYLQGEQVSFDWFQGAWEWMIAWTIAMTGAALGAAGILGVTASWSRGNRVRGVWCTVAFLVAASEVFTCFAIDVARTGLASAVWSLLSAAAALAMAFWKGYRAPGFASIASALALRLAGFTLVVLTPSSCRDYSKLHCPFPKDFNGNAVFHVLLALSFLPLYAGIASKLRRAAASSSFAEAAMSVAPLNVLRGELELELSRIR